MREELKALARHCLARAREAFAEGEHLPAADAARGAINRFYYAALFAARALLALREVDSSKHTGGIALFQRHFLKTGLVDVEIGRTLARTFEKRQKADYADFATVTTEEAAGIRREVEAFIQECACVFDQIATAGDD